jgi:hypothetical protein
MALHHKTKEAAVAKYSALASELPTVHLREEILKDEKGFTPEQADEILETIVSEKGSGKDNPNNITEERPKSQSEALGLDMFNYNNLVGDDYEEYEKLVSTLPYGQMFDFVVYGAEPIMKALYPGLKDTPYKQIGVKIKSTEPIHTTRMEVKHIIELNNQLANSKRYYLLKK